MSNYLVNVFCFGQGQFEIITTKSGMSEVYKFIERNVPGIHPGIDKLEGHQYEQGNMDIIEVALDTPEVVNDTCTVYIREIKPGVETVYGSNLETGQKLMEKYQAAVWHISMTSIEPGLGWIVIA